MRFRYYFQLLPTSASVAPSYFGIIREYGWRRVGLIVQNENVFTVVRNNSEMNVIRVFSVIIVIEIIFPSTCLNLLHSTYRSSFLQSACVNCFLK